MPKKLWNEYKSYILSLASILALIIVMWIFNISCPIKHVTGLSCAGCGMSRAIFSALSLDFASAFEYHPLWVAVLPIIVSMVILSANGKYGAAKVVILSAAVLFLATWIIRLAVGDRIVTFEPDQSLVNRVIHQVSALFRDN